MSYPYSRRFVSSPYGWRRHPVTGAKSFHGGVDFAVPSGTAITAFAAGKVVDKRHTDERGNTITVSYKVGSKTVKMKYWHMRTPSPLQRGDKVIENQLIGVVGDTGTAALGDHLHLEIWVDGQAVDPLTWLDAKDEE